MDNSIVDREVGDGVSQMPVESHNQNGIKHSTQNHRCVDRCIDCGRQYVANLKPHWGYNIDSLSQV